MQQRTQEMGIRLALGAHTARVRNMAAVALGLASAWSFGVWLPARRAARVDSLVAVGVE